MDGDVTDAAFRELVLDKVKQTWGKLIDKLDEETKHLSGGEKVRVGVARTLIKGAKIMLLDEPTASLDSQAATEVRKVLSEINEKYPDTTIVCVSHDEDLIKSSKRSINLSDLQK
jgi:ABC-type lipoprotein export system ATPase subunit